MKYIFTSITTALIRIARILSTQISHTIQGIKTLPHTCARTLRQPHMQYHIALLLATILAFLLGWPLFLSTLPRVPSAFIRYL